MKHETRILKQRIELSAVQWCGIETQKRIRCEKRKSEECGGDQSLNGENTRLERLAQTRPEDRERRAIDRKDQYPKKHRALVTAPRRGETVDRGLRRIGMLGDESDREIVVEKSFGEAPEGR